jgi:hypothetical protein
MSKRTLFLIIALFVITAVLLTVAIYKPQVSKEIPTATPTPVPPAQAILYFGNPEIIASSAATFTYSVPINISAGKNKITAVQLELKYDPNLLTKVEIASGSFYLKPIVALDKIDDIAGRISYALFDSRPMENELSGKSDLAILKFTVKSKIYEKAVIEFLPKSLVIAEGVSGSILKEGKQGEFFVGTKPATSSAKPIQ